MALILLLLYISAVSLSVSETLTDWREALTVISCWVCSSHWCCQHKYLQYLSSIAAHADVAPWESLLPFTSPLFSWCCQAVRHWSCDRFTLVAFHPDFSWPWGCVAPGQVSSAPGVWPECSVTLPCHHRACSAPPLELCSYSREIVVNCTTAVASLKNTLSQSRNPVWYFYSLIKCGHWKKHLFLPVSSSHCWGLMPLGTFLSGTLPEFLVEHFRTVCVSRTVELFYFHTLWLSKKFCHRKAQSFCKAGEMTQLK